MKNYNWSAFYFVILVFFCVNMPNDSNSRFIFLSVLKTILSFIVPIGFLSSCSFPSNISCNFYFLQLQQISLFRVSKSLMWNFIYRSDQRKIFLQIFNCFVVALDSSNKFLTVTLVDFLVQMFQKTLVPQNENHL